MPSTSQAREASAPLPPPPPPPPPPSLPLPLPNTARGEPIDISLGGGGGGGASSLRGVRGVAAWFSWVHSPMSGEKKRWEGRGRAGQVAVRLDPLADERRQLHHVHALRRPGLGGRGVEVGGGMEGEEEKEWVGNTARRYGRGHASVGPDGRVVSASGRASLHL